MQSTPMKETDRQDVLAIETLLAAHAEKAPPLVHDQAVASAAPPVHVAPPISAGAPGPLVEPPLRAPDARDIAVEVENARSSEIKVDGLRPADAQPMSKWARRVTMAVLALVGATTAAAWQQYGDQAKAMAAEWAPPFVLAALPSSAGSAAAEQPSASAVQANAAEQVPAPQPAAATAADQPPPAVIAATPPAAEPSQLQSMAHDLAAMGQQVEELKATIAQLKASQGQMARDLAKASEVKASEVKTSEIKASEAKSADAKPAEPTVRPKVSALTPPAQRPAAPPPVRKPKPVVSTYSPAYAPAPAAIAPPPPAQTIADDGQPVVRPPMPLR